MTIQSLAHNTYSEKSHKYSENCGCFWIKWISKAVVEKLCEVDTSKTCCGLVFKRRKRKCTVPVSYILLNPFPSFLFPCVTVVWTTVYSKPPVQACSVSFWTLDDPAFDDIKTLVLIVSCHIHVLANLQHSQKCGIQWPVCQLFYRGI